MKTIILLDSCIKSPDFSKSRIGQYQKSLISIFRHEKFFRDNNFDFLFVDNSIDTIEEAPYLKKLLPDYVKIITKKENNYGKLNKGAGCFEHWKISKKEWEDYDYLIHFEIRQTLVNINFFEEFLKEPISIFSWDSKINSITGEFKNKDSRIQIEDNIDFSKPQDNNFYTGLMSFEIKYFIDLVDKIDLNQVVENKMFFEVIIMVFAYNDLKKFKIIEKVDVIRYGNGLENR